MSPLRTFMLNLLSSHNGDVQLVADNAALTMEKAPPSRPNQPALAAMGGSSHSCTRWETDEPSPGRASDKGAKTLGPVLALSLQRRPHPLLCKNSSPACPIRKLSPKVHPDESHEDVISPSPGLRLESKRALSACHQSPAPVPTQEQREIHCDAGGQESHRSQEETKLHQATSTT